MIKDILNFIEEKKVKIATQEKERNLRGEKRVCCIMTLAELQRELSSKFDIKEKVKWLIQFKLN